MMKSGERLMDKKEFRRKLISLVLPITFQQFMLAVVSASDALMVGVIGQDLLSAVSLAGQITFVYNLFLAAMTIYVCRPVLGKRRQRFCRADPRDRSEKLFVCFLGLLHRGHISAGTAYEDLYL